MLGVQWEMIMGRLGYLFGRNVGFLALTMLRIRSKDFLRLSGVAWIEIVMCIFISINMVFSRYIYFKDCDKSFNKIYFDHI